MTTLIRNATLPAALAPEGVPSGPVDVLLDGATIASVTPHDDARGDDTVTAAEVVDATGLTLVPGLVDTHVHLLGREHLDAMADAGVTTAVDLGTYPDSLLHELRSLTDTTSFLSAGSAASAPGGHQTTLMGFPADSAVTGPDDAARFVDWRVENGSDVIKIIVEDPHNPTAHALSPETLRALVAAAHARGLLTIAHVVTAYSFTMGLDAGVDVLTHAPLDRPLDAEQVTRIVETGTIVSPTLIMMKGVAAARAGQPGPVLSMENSIESVRRLHAAGATIVAGTDANASPGSPSPVPHGTGLHDELDLLVEAGLSPAEAIVAATSGAAASVRLDDRGMVAPGKRADLLLLEDDPALDVAAVRGGRQVWIAGRRVR